MAIKEHPIKLPLDLILAQGNEFLMRCSKGSKYVRTEHRTESNLEPFDTGSVRTGTLIYEEVASEGESEPGDRILLCVIIEVAFVLCSLCGHSHH